MNFCSDNVTAASPEIMAALLAANHDAAMPYGADHWTQRLTERFCELFEREVVIFPVATGSAANALALATLAPPYGAIYCHADSHINLDECGAPEFYTGGAKLVSIAGDQGKLSATRLTTCLEQAGVAVVHHVQPAALSLTQATEVGTVYTSAEIYRLAEIAHARHLAVHMDGARFANALVHVGCSPADLTWKVGVDVLSFGATKNGALAAEVVVFFDPDQSGEFIYRRKRGGHLFSKMRFLSAQLEAYLTDDLWLKNANHANQMAAILAQKLSTLPGASLCYPVEANEIFIRLPEPIITGLLADGFQFYRWDGGQTLRLVTAFNTRPEDVDALVTSAQAHAQTMAQSMIPTLDSAEKLTESKPSEPIV